MTSVDSTANINRIIEILKNDTALSAVIRKFKFGEDDGNIHDDSPPYILVTTPNRPILTKDSFGIGDGSSDVSTLVQYVIKIFVLEHDSKSAETKLYDIVKQVIDILRANPRLKEPVGLTDPKCIRSVLFPGEIPSSDRGKENLSFEITIQCQIGSAISMTLPGALVVDLLSVENGSEGFDFDENFIDDQKRIVDSTMEKGTFLLEYENTSTVETALLTLLGTSGNITLTKNGNSRILNVEFITVNPTPKFDEIERSILHVEVTA